GAGFALTARDKNGQGFVLRGRAVGGMAAVWIDEEPVAAKAGIDFRAVLDALPIPVWLRDKTLALVWGNQSFASAVGAANPDAAVTAQGTLDKTERDLAATARNQGTAYEARRFAVIGEQRRALVFTETPVDGAGIVGSALDVTD